MAPTSKPLPSASLHLVLALLDGELHGYALIGRVSELSGGAVRMGPGTLYGTIKRMLDAELIQDLDSRGGEEDDPRRRYYRITDLGRRALELEIEGLASILGTAQRRHALKRT